MKKIIAALDGLKYSKSTRDYSIYLAKKNNAHLVGVFMDDYSYTSYKIYELVTKEGVSETMLEKYEAADKLARTAAAADFKIFCEKEGLAFSVHHDKNFAIKELKHESIYADLVVIDKTETLTHYREKLPTHFIRDLLTDAQCPVLVVPAKYKPIEKLMLLYDGEPSSVHAIKMFCCMLPFAAEMPAEVVVVKQPGDTLQVPDSRLMKEFMKRHYPKATYTVLKGLAENEIVPHLKQQQQNILVVLGAYRRGTVSRWFRQSMADTLMKETNVPLFIAHNK
jgi:hypothetical protein